MHGMGTLLAALGAIALAPSTGPTGAVTPDTVAPGSPVTFSVVCATDVGSAGVAGTALGLSSRIPMEPGRSPGVFSTTVNLPADIQEGTYDVGIDCADGTATSVRLVVAPTGGVPTGGGSAARGPDGALLATGSALLAVGGVGAVLLRRRPA